ncbi:hypothetical protein N0V90_009170 [Kalmusia sp. IMI 367209]|nr:hypothetical protein N0V90_009170 [Kalmusia sp. IMI 367209]
MDRLYIPDCDLTNPASVEAEITFIDALLSSMDPSESTYAHDKAYYDDHIKNLCGCLAQILPPFQSQDVSSATPGSATEWSDAPRKRPREPSGSDSDYPRNGFHESPGSPMSIDFDMPGAWPPESSFKRSRQTDPMISGNTVDLTDEELFSLQSTMPQNFSDPFPELLHTYQPVQAHSMPADAFVNDAMSLDDLAQFMVTPTPALGGYAHNQPVRNGLFPPPLNLSLPNARPGHDPGPIFSPSPSPGTDPDVVNALIESIKCQDDIPREQTPKAMSSTLMEHQKQALAWLLNMEKGKNKGSILADEMGLGKTIEGLSLVLANPSRNQARKTTLIVAPVALMRQWEKEIERHVRPTHRLSVYTYHRNGKKADFSTLRKYDVVLTTFGTLAHELKRIETRKESEANDRERRDPHFRRSAKDRLALLGEDCLWYRVILDEAQCIKNRSTLTSKAATELQSELRLCMTGTPMQNSIEELYPLIRFLHINPYQTWTAFNDHFVKPIKGNHDVSRERGMNRLQALIKSITLRREKTTIVDGKPICDLPPKHVEKTSVEFSDAEHELYKAVETRSQIKFNRYLKKGTVSNNYANILVMLLRLRQICCHPHLVKDLGVQVSTDGIAEDDLKRRAQLLGPDVVRRLKEVDGFECPICYETEINPTIIVPCGHTCCGECFQKLVDPARAVQDGNENSSPKCPHCRGTLSSERITDYRHFCKVFCPDKYEELRQALTGDISSGLDEEKQTYEEDEDESEYDDSSDDEDDIDAKDPTLGGFIVDDDVDDDGMEMTVRNRFVSDDSGAAAVAMPSRNKGKGKAKVEATLNLAQLKKLSLRNRAARKKYFKRLRKEFKSSAKIDKTMELLANIRANDPTEKTLIFSSFTTLLDLLEVPLSKKKYKYQRYDGSMRFDDRVDAVNEFMDNADENIMLISIKAGNAGLNLNKASQVIMLDPFWNPFVEDQAVDRAHRMPQKREVHVHRVLVPETVEDRICALQDKKRDIINTALDERAGNSLTKLSVGELRNLFGL